MNLTEIISEIIQNGDNDKQNTIKNCLNIWANSGSILSKQGTSSAIGLRVQRQIIAEILSEILTAIFSERKAQADMLESLLFELGWPLPPRLSLKLDDDTERFTVTRPQSAWK